MSLAPTFIIGTGRWLGGGEHWRWGPLQPAQRERWEAHGHDPIALAGLGWEILMDRFAAVEREVPTDRWLEMCYEALCDRPAEVLERITTFMGIRWPAAWNDIAWEDRFVARSHAWKRRSDPADQCTLEAVLEGALQRYGYG